MAATRQRMGLGQVNVGGAEVPSLWALIALELGALVMLRRYFRRHHGG